MQSGADASVALERNGDVTVSSVGTVTIDAPSVAVTGDVYARVDPVPTARRRGSGMAVKPLQPARKFLGSGFAFPLRIDANGGFAFASYEADIEQAIFHILSTAKGERVMVPDFGCGMHDLVFAEHRDPGRRRCIGSPPGAGAVGTAHGRARRHRHRQR